MLVNWLVPLIGVYVHDLILKRILNFLFENPFTYKYLYNISVKVQRIEKLLNNVMKMMKVFVLFQYHVVKSISYLDLIVSEVPKLLKTTALNDDQPI